VYIRDGRIYQHGPGIEFLPRDHLTPSFDHGHFTETDETEWGAFPSGRE
jgi:hypothetical protein